MNKLYIPLFLAFALLLSACSQSLSAVKVGIEQNAEFNEIVLADVVAAKALAVQGNDPLGEMCWQYVEDFALANAPGVESEAGKVVGVFSAYQKARNVRHTVVEVKISDDFRLACGPMLTESMGVLGRIGLRLAL